jgi:hypothetical protein
MRAVLFLALLVAFEEAACHPSADGGTAGPAGECAKCHMPEFQAAKNPVHVGERPQTCGICHTQHAWRPSRVDHPWPLTGAHARGHCFYCHDGDEPIFRGTKKECIDCHRPDYEKARDHERNPTTCQTCHSTEAWSPALPDHPEIPKAPEPDAGAPLDAAAAVDVDAATPAAHPKPKPKPTSTSTPKPDTTTGSSRRVRR